MSLPDRYNPADVEARIYKWWEDGSYFSADDKSTKPPYCIIMPPPNVTGFLHLGHAMDHYMQDCLIRFKRMSGFNALWLPGTDHAGIATQSVVEKELAKEKLTRTGLGREAFVAKIWEWKHQYGDRIYTQMRRLGNSCDWSRATFTLDDGVSLAVRKVFSDLYKKGWIYRGKRLVNWSGALETAISDLEVEHRDVKGSLWHIRYPLENPTGEISYLIVATTRPETLLGDTALCVHPEDERYQNLVGQKVRLPLTQRLIPIIADSYVDPKFGSGVVKITPAHDFNDYKVGVTHRLPMISILDQRSRTNENAGPYKGLSVQEARKRVLADLTAQGLLDKEEPHNLSVGHCSRTGVVVEPYLSEQWFVKTELLSVPAQRAVQSGTTQIDPESWTKVYLHWMNIIEDWCISRQLWWGHRIPAWHCTSCKGVTVSESDPTHCSSCNSTSIEQDPDVLDTWFSSALWPFSTLGWPKQSEALKTFYPTSALVTGNDILFFWVARMMMMGLEFVRDVPFRKVLLHGMIRDSQGRKMSKSLGNSVDPVEILDRHGSDALRFSFLAHIHSGRDFKFSEARVEGYRNFMNKIWNASRFALQNLQDFESPSQGIGALPQRGHLSPFDQWILRKLAHTESVVEEAMEQDRLSDAATALYQFVWYELCDWYIELSKPILQAQPSPERSATQLVLAQVLNRALRLLHPFAPFITEEIYQKIPLRSQACITATYPNPILDKDLLALGSEAAAFAVDLTREVITSIRNIRGENRISPAVKINVRLSPNNDRTQKILGENRQVIQSLGRVEDLQIGEEGNLAKCAVARVQAEDCTVTVVVPLEGLVDLQAEVARLQKQLEKLEKETASLAGRLNNENFVKNAAPEVVETDRKTLEINRQQIRSMRESLERFL